MAGKSMSPACARALLLWAAALLGACSDYAGENSGPGGPGGSVGAITFAITDAASDEIVSCRVEISNVRLVNLAGTEVPVLSSPVQVDLASLADLSQVVAVTNVPVAIYTQARVTIDFFGATCFLVGHTSEASILDDSGAPVGGTVQVPLHFDAPFTANVGTNTLLELDFDLDQSFLVDQVGNTVTLVPAFLLRVQPVAPKELFVPVMLESVSLAASTFTGTVHSTGGTVVSTVTFHVAPATTFQVDGVPSTGAAGLAALQALGPGAPVECFGTVTGTSARIEVTHCQAGIGTFDGASDIVHGHVIGRTGGPGSDAVLEVLGQSVDANHTTFTNAQTFLVNTGFATTMVVRAGSTSAFDMDDVNVGQRVRVFGTLTGTTMDATAATAIVRQERTRVFGAAAGAPAGGTLTMNLSHVDQLPQNVFTWTDSGTTPPDPALFRANVGALGNGLAIVPGTNVSAHGNFAPIDDVNQDFVAGAVANADTGPSLLFVRNLAGTGFNVGVTTTTMQIQLSITGVAAAGETAVIDQGHAGSTPLPAAPTPTVTRPGMTGTYSLRDRGTNTIQVFTQFSDYTSALGSVMAQGATLIQIGALGSYNAGTNTIDAAVSTAVVE